MELNRLKLGLADGFPTYIRDRFVSTLVLGKSGTGKSSVLAQWFAQDGNRICRIVIEPSGFLAETMYALCRGQALNCSLQNPISINPLQAPYDPNAIVDIICEALNQVIRLTTPNERLTVKMHGLLDEAIKYCLAHGRANLLNVRNRIINAPGSSETKDGVIQRLNFLLNDERMLPILCGHNPVKWGELIARGQSFILNCFGMGTEKMIFLGNLISQGIKNYFRMERPAVYQPCALYVDEAHLFTSPNFMDILKEGRKYKLACVLASQDLAMFSETMTRVLLNVGNIVCFRVGAREATAIGREMNLPATDLQFLEKWHAAYLTPDGVGIVKVSRPPFVKPITITNQAAPKSKAPGWFTLESCPAASA